MDTELMVSAYLELRSQRELLKQEYETRDAELKEDMSKIEAALLDTCNQVGADSIKTQVGTVIRSVKERYFCNDWENFRPFLLEHQAIDLLEKRIHQGNFKQFMQEHTDDGLPPGVNVMREFGITVRKPSNS